MQSITGRLTITEQALGCGFSGQFNEAGKGYMRAPDGERYPQKSGLAPILGCRVDCCLNIPVAEYRAKCAWLVLFTLPKGAIVLLYRLIDFTLLGSVRRGWEYGNRSLRQVKFKSDHDLSKIHYFALKRVCIYAYHCSACLISDMLKIATFPIFLILMQIFSIFGLIFPHHARFVISKLQILWGYDNILHRVALAHGHSPRWFNSSCVFDVAPCFHSIEHFNKLNLYMYLLRDFHPRETRSLWLALFHTFSDNRALFAEADYNRFIKSLERSKRAIGIFSDIRREELQEIREGVDIKTKKVEKLILKIRDELAKLNEEERSSCQQPFQEMEDKLKSTSDRLEKIKVIRIFRKSLRRKFGYENTKIALIIESTLEIQDSLMQEHIRAWADSAHECLDRYIDGEATLDQLKNCLHFHY